MENSQKRCAYCPRWFQPDPRVGDQQKSCPRKKCRKARHRDARVAWQVKNPSYGQGPAHVHSQRRWLDKPENKGYLRRYRAAHPAFVAADNRRRSERRRLQKARERQARVSDMKDAIHRREIARIRGLSASDMMDATGVRLDGLLAHLFTCPWSSRADMKDAMALIPPAGVG